jgi:toxin-antitoxin system PIN domain toxin
MIALDTQILVYAQREDSAWHEQAKNCVRQLAEGRSPWAIPWNCIHEFLAVVTHPRIYKPPTPVADALLQVEYWMDSPTLRLIGEPTGFWDRFSALVSEGRAAGPRIHDARVAAVCLAHGVREFWSADRDFSRFSTLRVRNPMIAAAR